LSFQKHPFIAFWVTFTPGKYATIMLRAKQFNITSQFGRANQSNLWKLVREIDIGSRKKYFEQNLKNIARSAFGGANTR
jgi:hypothetical protein